MLWFVGWDAGMCSLSTSSGLLLSNQTHLIHTDLAAAAAPWQRSASGSRTQLVAGSEADDDLHFGRPLVTRITQCIQRWPKSTGAQYIIGQAPAISAISCSRQSATASSDTLVPPWIIDS